MMIEDWEIGQLYWTCLKAHGGNEEKAIADVKRNILMILPKLRIYICF